MRMNFILSVITIFAIFLLLFTLRTENTVSGQTQGESCTALSNEKTLPSFTESASISFNVVGTLSEQEAINRFGGPLKTDAGNKCRTRFLSAFGAASLDCVRNCARASLGNFLCQGSASFNGQCSPATCSASVTPYTITDRRHGDVYDMTRGTVTCSSTGDFKIKCGCTGLELSNKH